MPLSVNSIWLAATDLIVNKKDMPKWKAYFSIGSAKAYFTDDRVPFSRERRRKNFRTGDQRFRAAFLNEPDTGLDFRQHRAGFEVALGKILFGFRKCHDDRASSGPALPKLRQTFSTAVEITSRSAAISFAEHGGREIFIDDSRGTMKIPLFILHYGNPAPARRDDDIACVNQVTDDVRFDDPDRLWRRNYAPPTTARILDHRPFFDAHTVFGVFFLVKLANGFGRFLESGIIFVHQRLRHDRGDRLFSVATTKLILHRLLDLVADGSLRVRANRIQRNFMQDPARIFAAQKDKPDLRAVPVGNHNPETAFDKIGNVARSLNHRRVLVGHTPVLVVFDRENCRRWR